MTKQVRLSLALAGTFVVVVAALLTLTAMSNEPEAAPAQSGESRLVRAESHILGQKGSSDVTFVEFLDFECEGCLAAYPAIEQLRKDLHQRYADDPAVRRIIDRIAAETHARQSRDARS